MSKAPSLKQIKTSVELVQWTTGTWVALGQPFLSGDLLYAWIPAVYVVLGWLLVRGSWRSGFSALRALTSPLLLHFIRISQNLQELTKLPLSSASSLMVSSFRACISNFFSPWMLFLIPLTRCNLVFLL